MKKATALVLSVILLQVTACTQEKPVKETGKTEAAEIVSQKIVMNAQDSIYGYYLAALPAGGINGVLLLFPGFGERAENVFRESKLENVAYDNHLLTIVFAEGNKLYIDSTVEANINAVLNDVIKRYKVNPEKFVLGGFSAGGMVALRYTELCNQYPGKYPIKPKGVFMADSPIDIFTVWNNMEEFARDRLSDMAVEEAERAMASIKADHGVPSENIAYYAGVTAFSMNKEYGQNEQYLKNTPVRAYHDVDIPWRLINRNQTVRQANFYVTSELINRLMLMGNQKAEFMQTYQTGYRADGRRHPHSWSIVEETECIQWINGLL